MSPDCELVADYAARGSETAFRALVSRHVDLVYATALRQTGDRGLAEEITQNVFIALARKAPRLGGLETLAGWLHRTTILESKARIRSELRRRRREELAGESILAQPSEDSLSPLVPLLDEGLLRLEEPDRLALALRYLEGRDVAEVSAALGVSSDATRKRISRALDRLGEFFRRRGFSSACGATAAAVLGQSTQAAPAALAAAAANAGLAAGATTGGLGVILLHIMTLTKTQTALICALIAAAPMTWEWRAQARAQTELSTASADFAASQQRAAALEAELARARRTLQTSDRAALDFQARLTTLEARRSGQTPAPAYHWDDRSPYVRLPKELIGQIATYSCFYYKGRLSDIATDSLQLDADETARIEAAVAQMLAAIYAAQAKNTRQVEPNSREQGQRPPGEVRAFEVGAIGEELAKIRSDFYAQLDAIAGPERASELEAGLKGQFPMSTENFGLSSGYQFFPQAHRMWFAKPKAGDGYLQYSVEVKDSGNFSAGKDLDEIPANVALALQDWIALARSPKTAK